MGKAKRKLLRKGTEIREQHQKEKHENGWKRLKLNSQSNRFNKFKM